MDLASRLAHFRRPALLSCALGCLCLAQGCGEDSGADTTGSAELTSTTSTTGTTGTEESTESGDSTGAPTGEWCFGNPGPDPVWAFGEIGGTYQVSSAAACPPFFGAGTVYDIVVDADARSVSFVTDLGSRDYTWDEDEFDGVCEISSEFPGGFEIWIMDDLENGVALAFSQGGQFERFQGFVSSTTGCVLPKVAG